MDKNIHSDETIKQTKKDTTVKHNNLNLNALKYGIAALSFVSFITTSNGLEKAMPDEGKLTPYLISFGVQVLVLVVGTGLFNIINKVRKLDIKKELKSLTAIFIIIPYVAAVLFSSFFSYVYLSNNAYKYVKETDYNIKIDMFFNKEITNIKNLNETAGKVILAEIQNSVPEFKETLVQFQKNATSEIAEITNTNNLSLYQKNTIDRSVIFDSDAINNSANVSSGSLLKLQNTERSLHITADLYEEYYKTYQKLFNEIKSITTQNNLMSTYDELLILKDRLSALNEDLNKVEAPTEYYTTYIQSSVSSIKAYISGLDTAIRSLISVCEEINNSSHINSGTINLNDVYNTIYSTVNVSDDKIISAINELKSIISAYLNTIDSNNIDDTTLQNLSACITYLGEFQKHKDLNNKINIFEETVLNQVYVIEYGSEENKINASTNDGIVEEASSEVMTSSSININLLGIDNWNSKRREELNQFINIIKSLPDFETIISTIQHSSSHTREYIKILENNINYKNKTLKEAYDINRDSLENISDIERAWNYIFSDYKYMAIYCIFVAVFLDMTPFFVGMFTYLITEKKKISANEKEDTSEPADASLKSPESSNA